MGSPNTLFNVAGWIASSIIIFGFLTFGLHVSIRTEVFLKVLLFTGIFFVTVLYLAQAALIRLKLLNFAGYVVAGTFITAVGTGNCVWS